MGRDQEPPGRALGSSGGRRRRRPEGPGLHEGRRLEPRRAPARPRPGRRAEARPEGRRGAASPSGPDARDDLPEALDAHPRLLRGRHVAARRRRALPLRVGPAARPWRERQGHRARALALPRRDHDPHVRPGGRRGARPQRDDPGDQRPDGQLAPVPGARRRDDDPRAARPVRGRAAHLPRRRQQRLRVADGRRGEARDALHRRGAARLRARRGRARRRAHRRRGDRRGRARRQRPARGERRRRGLLHRRLDEHGPGGGARAPPARPRRLRDHRRAAGAREKTTRSCCTASPRTTARRSPKRSRTGRSRRSGTRPRTACTPRRLSWRSTVR